MLAKTSGCCLSCSPGLSLAVLSCWMVAHRASCPHLCHPPSRSMKRYVRRVHGAVSFDVVFPPLHFLTPTSGTWWQSMLPFRPATAGPRPSTSAGRPLSSAGRPGTARTSARRCAFGAAGRCPRQIVLLCGSVRLLADADTQATLWQRVGGGS